jgi:hypothetical protein
MSGRDQHIMGRLQTERPGGSGNPSVRGTREPVTAAPHQFTGVTGRHAVVTSHFEVTTRLDNPAHTHQTPRVMPTRRVVLRRGVNLLVASRRLFEVR